MAVKDMLRIERSKRPGTVALFVSGKFYTACEVSAYMLWRKGCAKGTLEHHLRSCTRNYTREAWVLQLDLRGYFMSIDRRGLR